jgi:DNA-directed RNA polymerase specialized sigma24 family protein
VDVRVVPPDKPLGLAELFVEHGDRLGRLAYLLVGSVPDAEDVVATVYARVVRRDLDDIRDPVAYLGRAVVNEARSHHRRVRRDRRVRIRLGAAAPQVGLGATELLDALKVLNPLERTVVVLHYYDDRTIDEIATLLDVPRGTAASAQSRALGKLRKVLEP